MTDEYSRRLAAAREAEAAAARTSVPGSRSPAPGSRDSSPGSQDAGSARDRELAASGRVVPIHRPGEIPVHPAIDPEQAWLTLSPEFRDQMTRAVGTPLDRWARVDEGRTSALLLGNGALVAATPRIGAPGHDLETKVLLNPEKSKTETINESTGRRSGTSAAGRGLDRRPVSTGLDLLPSDLRDFLGHLPARAQELMQKPFLTSTEAPRNEFQFFQLAWGNGRRDWQVFCYLFDDRRLTVVTGKGTLHNATDASWQLTCRLFAVRRPH